MTLIDKYKVLKEIERIDNKYSGASHGRLTMELYMIIKSLPSPTLPEPMVRWALINNDPEVEEIQLFHPSNDIKCENHQKYIKKMEGRNFRLVQVEIREVKP